MFLFAIALISLTAGYALLLGSAAYGFATVTRRRHSTAEQATPFVSVVVPARNEEASIGACLESILANNYPAFEVIVVDDASTDATAKIVRQYAPVEELVTAGVSSTAAFQHPTDDTPVLLVSINHEGERAHKKFALARGVDEARGEVILTTDADCTVPPTWIHSMIRHFHADTGVVTGPVLYRESPTVFGRIQSLEFLGLVALGAGFVGVGRPHLCNSANLAYRRQAYDDVGGYEGLENVSTGDDEMLVHKMAYESPWRIRTCMDGEAAVETDASASLSEFFAQRRRWTSAHARYPHRKFTVVSVLCYLFFVGLAAAAVAGAWELLAAALVVKISAEASVLRPATRRFARESLLPLLIPAQLVHIPYILIIGLAGTVGGYEWKGRQLSR